MKSMSWFGSAAILCMIPAALAACGDDTTTGSGGGTGTSTGSGGETSTTSSSTGATSSSTGSGGTVLPTDAQTPPQGGVEVMKAWIATSAYMTWHCEKDVHASKDPSPHSFNRICSNDKLAGAGATGEFPVGSAGVKELWDKIGGTIVGYAVYVKTEAQSAGGANWYWYEDNPTIAAPVGPIVADGFGTSGQEKDICVSCHIKASTTFAATARDLVFTQVP